MIHHLLIAFTYVILSTAYATEATTSEAKEQPKTVTVTLETGNLEMDKFLNSCTVVANATLSDRILPGIAGTVFQYNGQDYEVRVQSFEDTTGELPKNMTFQEYVTKNNLRDLKSNIVHPLPSLSFDCFDFRHAKLNDGVYFTVVLRKLEK